MKLTIISLLSLGLGILMAYGCLKTAEQIAKATMPRIEISLDQ